MKQCVKCKKGFEIAEKDTIFYTKMEVPEPALCPRCRSIRRLTFRNERSLFKRNCDLCKKEIISMYGPNSAYIIYCPDCWHSDRWSGMDFGIAFDFNRTFFSQFQEMRLKVPRYSLEIINCINSDYSNISMENKNCYLAFGTARCEDSYYTRKAAGSKNCVDVNNIYDSELLYESILCSNSYNLNFAQNCTACTDCNFIRDCVNCMNCTFCCNLKNKQYCWFNEQLTEEEYKSRISLLYMDTHSGMQDAKKLFDGFDITIPKKSSQNINCINCTGDFLKNCKNCIECYDMGNSEDCKYCSDAMYGTVDAMDCTAATLRCSVAYECQSCTEATFIRFCNLVRNLSSHIDYSDLINSSHDLFGCVGLNHAEYCILNKKYTKDSYVDLRGKIILHMKKTGEWGEFFPAAFSPFGYNETIGYDFERIDATEAKEYKLNWTHENRGVFGKETIANLSIPDSIKDVKDNILEQILACKNCKKDYKLIKQELKFYRNKSLPIPQECPDCRNYRRIKIFNPRHLWHRKCMNDECKNEFETTYAPDRPEKVYCEECYQKEVI